MPKTYTDHEGHEFKTLSEMARFWNIPDSTLQNRLDNMGLDIKQALTMSSEEARYLRFTCQDHLGNTFRSKNEMCKHYGIPRSIFFGRIGIGWSLEKALTEPICEIPDNAIKITDHLGQEFPSVNAMCKHWGAVRSTFRARIEMGWSMEAALTAPKKQVNMERQEWTDHLGNVYPSLNKMCEAYGITRYVFSGRYKDLGWSLEKALTTPNVISSNEMTDEFGNVFPTARDMAHFYNLPKHVFQGNHPTLKQFHNKVGAAFKNRTYGGTKILKMQKWPYFLVLEKGHEIIVHVREVLDLYHNNGFDPIVERKTGDPNLKILKCTGFPDYLVEFYGRRTSMSYWEILKYLHDTNFGLSVKGYDPDANVPGKEVR